MKKNLFNIDAEAFIIQQLLEESEGEITQELEERMAINEAERESKAVGYCYVIKEFKAKAEMIKKEIERLNNMKKQYEKYCDELENRLLDSVLTIGPIKTDKINISSRKTKAVHIIKEEALPDHFLRIKTEANKQAIKDAIEAGEEVPGAEIVENYSLYVK
jgi:phage host-nuclease inhibitor protein Gam